MSNTNARPLTAVERARLMWVAGHDTLDIAKRIGMSEAIVYAWRVRGIL